MMINKKSVLCCKDCRFIIPRMVSYCPRIKKSLYR
nr:MAG TPA: hypothetical protein [Caudoviricetes sp.]